ncbi:MAG: tRNA uridine-5-carboxymethylaminomethyl(34) synthesis GTPase MnmE [Thermoleophilia bacterium]
MDDPRMSDPNYSHSTSYAAASERPTIAAVSTAIGAGAIGIVRMSGPASLEIGRRVFRPRRGSQRDMESHRLRYGSVVDPANAEVIDEVLFVFLAAPATYTREDMVEIHCHGGPAAQRAVLGLLLREGARPAEPGEFTKRAYLNGRIDLAQAESVASIVSARTSAALKAAVHRLEGGLGDRLRAIRRDMVGALAQIEATIDFSDEDIDDVDREAVAAGLTSARFQLARLLATAFAGQALEEGVRTAIIGRPNVGKSSLLNSLLMRERAIVSDIPGTTRDTIEEYVEVGGLPLRLIDTAGLRDGGDEIEALGVERSRRAAEEADLMLIVLDASVGLTEEDRRLISAARPEHTVLVWNKIDLTRERAQPDVIPLGNGVAVVEVSARTGEGLDVLRESMVEVLLGEGRVCLEEPLLATERQRRLVEEAVESVDRALDALAAGRPEELVAEDVRWAIESLGAITGEQVVPDLIDEIFSRFCIGK